MLPDKEASSRLEMWKFNEADENVTDTSVPQIFRSPPTKEEIDGVETVS